MSGASRTVFSLVCAASSMHVSLTCVLAAVDAHSPPCTPRRLQALPAVLMRQLLGVQYNAYGVSYNEQVFR